MNSRRRVNSTVRQLSLCTNRTLTKRTISNFVSGGSLGALVVVFGVILFVLAVPLFIPTTHGPATGGFVFSISRRAFTDVLITLLAVIAAGLLLIAAALRRRHTLKRCRINRWTSVDSLFLNLIGAAKVECNRRAR
jgi:fumarate reductase subunit D